MTQLSNQRTVVDAGIEQGAVSRWNLPTGLPGLSLALRRLWGIELTARLPTLARSALAAAVLLLLWLSLIPGQMQHRTALPKDAEHFLAYFLTGICVACAFASRRTLAALTALTALLVLLAAALEIAQSFSPGRTANITDFLASAAGAATGVFLTWLALKLLLRGAVAYKASGGRSEGDAS